MKPVHISSLAINVARFAKPKTICKITKGRFMGMRSLVINVASCTEINGGWENTLRLCMKRSHLKGENVPCVNRSFQPLLKWTFTETKSIIPQNIIVSLVSRHLELVECWKHTFHTYTAVKASFHVKYVVENWERPLIFGITWEYTAGRNHLPANIALTGEAQYLCCTTTRNRDTGQNLKRRGKRRRRQNSRFWAVCKLVNKCDIPIPNLPGMPRVRESCWVPWCREGQSSARSPAWPVTGSTDWTSPVSPWRAPPGVMSYYNTFIVI